MVQAIAAWREREAQRINIPRQRLLKDEQLLEIAAMAPDNAEALARARGITRGFAEGKSGAVAAGRRSPRPRRCRRTRSAAAPSASATAAGLAGSGGAAEGAAERGGGAE